MLGEGYSMADNNDLEKRVKRLEQQVQESKDDRNLIKRLIRLLVKAWKASRGQENTALDKIDRILREDEDTDKGEPS
jgi:hypothetical protein